MNLDPIPPGYEPTIATGFNGFIGPVLVKSGSAPEAERRFRIAATGPRLNGAGMAHGGFLMAVADTIMGFTANEVLEGQRASTVTLNCDFVAGAKDGEIIEGSVAITRRTRSLIFLTCTLSAGERAVMAATGIWKIQGDA